MARPLQFITTEDILRAQVEEEERLRASRQLQGLAERDLAQVEQFGQPRTTAGVPTELPGGRATFTDPQGTTREFWEGGDLRSITMPTTAINDYSPKDKRDIQDLYQKRSIIARDPDLAGDEDARQSALDEIDQQISAFRPLPPQMREPTAQQQFEAALVQGPDGQMGTWDGNKFSPIEKSKAETTSQTKWQNDFKTEFNRLAKANENPLLAETKSRDEMIAEARAHANLIRDVVPDELALEGAPAEPGPPGPLDESLIEGGGIVRRGEGVVKTTGFRSPHPLAGLFGGANEEEKDLILQLTQVGRTPKEILAMFEKSIKD